MRILNFFLLIGILGLSGFYYFTIQEERNTQLAINDSLKFSLSVPREMPGVLGDKSVALSTDCFIWGPFKSYETVRVQTLLRRYGLIEKAVINDCFLPDRYIIYLRVESKTAALAFTKQLRQQKYPHVRPILEGENAYGVEIESFSTRKAAQDYLLSGKIPEIDGIVIKNQLGEPTESVNLTLQNLTTKERDALFSIWKAFPNKEIRSCSYQ